MSDHQTMIETSVRQLLAQHGLPASSNDTRLPRELWRAVVDAGLTEVLLIDDGSDPRDAVRNAVTILRECAYQAAPIPVLEAMVAHWLAARGGWSESADVATVAIDVNTPSLERNDFADNMPAAMLTRVPWGGEADAVYTLVRDESVIRIARFERTDVPLQRGQNLAGEPRDTLAPGPSPRLGTTTIDPLLVLALAALLRSAQMAGAMERTLDLALEHARTRVQFGKPIGGFQAVQQMLAQHANHLAAASAAVDLAVDYWGTGAAVMYAGIAKSRAGEAAGVAAECAHQVLAAMGYAMEHPLQKLTRRLWSWRDDFGNEVFWNARIGAHFLDTTPAPSVWAYLTQRHPLETEASP